LGLFLPCSSLISAVSSPHVNYSRCKGKCVNDLSLCLDRDVPTCTDFRKLDKCLLPDSPPYKEEVVEVDVVISNPRKPQEIPVISTNGRFSGSVSIPADSFKRGTVVRVSTWNGTLPEEDGTEEGSLSCSFPVFLVLLTLFQDECGEKEEKKRVSGLYDVTAYHPEGRQQAKPKGAITIGLLARLPVSDFVVFLLPRNIYPFLTYPCRKEQTFEMHVLPSIKEHQIRDGNARRTRG